MWSDSVEHKSSKELRGYLTHVAEQSERDFSELPAVIILDSLQHAGELSPGLPRLTAPYIIGTMNQVRVLS